MNLISYLQVEQDPNIALLYESVGESGVYLLTLIPVINGISGGNIDFSGVAPLSVINQGQTIAISGNFSSFITQGQTGLFYPIYNPSGYVTAMQTGILQPSGNYLTFSQSGLFYPANNPSGFVTASQTGIFVTDSQTGIYASLFYSISNPSGFIPSGNIIAGANVSIVPSGNSLVISASGGGGGSSVKWNSVNNIDLTSGFIAQPNSYNSIFIDSYTPITGFLPTTGVTDGTFVVFKDILGWPGFSSVPFTVTTTDGSATILTALSAEVTTEVLNRSYVIQTYVYYGRDNFWVSNSQFFTVPDSGVLSAGSLTYSNESILPTSVFTLSHLCASTGNRGALWIDSLASGTATIASSNSLDNDTISIEFH